MCFLFVSRHRLRSLESFSLPTSREDASVAFAKEFPGKFYGIPRFLNLRKAAETIFPEIGTVLGMVVGLFTFAKEMNVSEAQRTRNGDNDTQAGRR